MARGAIDAAVRDTVTGKDERDGQRAVVGKEPVRGLAVVAERLPVIGGHHEERAIERPLGTEP